MELDEHSAWLAGITTEHGGVTPDGAQIWVLFEGGHDSETVKAVMSYIGKTPANKITRAGLMELGANVRHLSVKGQRII